MIFKITFSATVIVISWVSWRQLLRRKSSTGFLGVCSKKKTRWVEEEANLWSSCLSPSSGRAGAWKAIFKWFFKKDFIYFYTEGKGGRKRGRETLIG